MDELLEYFSYKRNFLPSHYLLKIESYSLISKAEKYETDIFEAGGYKWRLTFYPNGDKNNNGNNYISLYLGIAETNNFGVGWEVNVIFHLFVYDQLTDTYLTIQAKQFHSMKTKCGFSQLLKLETFKNPENGYLVGDCCVFGAEVFVLKHTSNWESVWVDKSSLISNAAFTWKIKKYSTLKNGFYGSEVFAVGGRNWTLSIYPNEWLSIYLNLADWQSVSTKAAVYADFKLCVIDQINGKHLESKAKDFAWGFPKFMHLNYLRDASKGFIVRNTLIVKVDFLALSETKSFSKQQNSAEESHKAPAKRLKVND
ncbi:hypothetical protein UlMin_021257 [Ulmus minor]